MILREKIEKAQYASALGGHEIAFVAERGEPPFPVGVIETGERLLIARQNERTDHALQMIELRVRDVRGLERRSRGPRFAPDSRDIRFFHFDAPKRRFFAAWLYFGLDQPLSLCMGDSDVTAGGRPRIADLNRPRRRTRCSSFNTIYLHFEYALPCVSFAGAHRAHR
ncbi:hypothetical protein [Caballeronia sp. INDeC2]|uniref:hypothetical protein n=1 Tax=Caballeronia sp. INDeC2 TaxID=2921747 RepID=UPI002028E21A|nr:hypothetical protein [Caballeronia sp. INDeC2]